MGEATYYAKIFFKSKEEAEQALPKIKEFWLEGIKAEDFWQTNRGMSKGSVEEFWRQFEQNFPLITEYTKEAGIFGGDCNNSLAGKLSFGSVEEAEQMEVKGTEIWHHAYVWHFAEWDCQKDFVEKKFGALEMKWLSDEYIDPYGLL